MPIIEGKGKIYIPIVPPHNIQDDVNIVISNIEVNYETIKNEKLRIEGRIETINDTRVRIDNYQIKCRMDSMSHYLILEVPKRNGVLLGEIKV